MKISPIKEGSNISAIGSLSKHVSKTIDLRRLDQGLIHAILQEIDSCLSQGVLPVHNDHLKHLSEKGEILDYLLSMREHRLIGGILITKGHDNTPHRMTNIRLTYLGVKVLRPGV